MNIQDKTVQALSVLHPKWKDIFDKHYSKLKDALQVLLKCPMNNITPPIESIFSTFIFNPEDTKVVIIGQDPCPQRGDANGLALSSDGKESKSFINIKECLTRCGHKINSSDLRPWLYQGVMLLNMSLTTEVGQSNVHRSYWKPFVTAMIIELTSLVDGIHFFFWGKDAQAIKQYIKGKQCIHEYTHPNPLIDNSLPYEKKFINCTHFEEVSDVDWSTGAPIILYTDGGDVLHVKSSYAVYIPKMLRLYGLVQNGEYTMLDNHIQTKDKTSVGPTSQRGEYLAIVYALFIVKKLGMHNVTIVTDSANAVGIITEWTKKTEKYKNNDLVFIMRKLFEEVRHCVEIVHTKSHGKDSNSPYNQGNNIVDKVASHALKTCKDFDTHVDYQDVEFNL
jgi:uracil-DNA glycosylase